ncbi:MAG TPA: hypothetical protein VMV77_04740 [Bacteroidales bacterium]|nr:hypothetical protein [Bacteroidales bacterium]
METLFEKKTETRLVIIEPNQLEEVVRNSGLQIQEGEEIKQSYLPFLNQLSEIQSQASKINFESPNDLDENIARELRLKTIKVRTGSLNLKNDRKKLSMLKGNLEQASYNVIAASCKLTEEIFSNVEKAREIAEKKNKEQLRADRTEKLSPYTESASMYPLGEMSEQQFNELHSGLRISHENKLAAEKKAEEDRIAKGKAEAEAREAQRLENIRLQEEAKEREKQIAYEREKVREENEEKERFAEVERKMNARILADQKERADKERVELLAKAEKERIARENIEAEIKRKKDADDKLKRDKAAAEKKAKLAPDKEKLLAFGQALNDVPRPEIKSIEAASIMANINGLLVKLNNYIIENANKL